MFLHHKGETDTRISNIVFKDVTYYIVGNVSQEVIKLLDDNGATRDLYLSDIVSHVIADSTEPDEYSEAKDLFERPIVSSQWVRLSVKCGKQLPKEIFALEGRLFSGICICPHQLNAFDSKVVWGLATYHGAMCQMILDRSVTHLVTTSTSGEKYLTAMEHKGGVKIITPDWLIDCVSKKQRLDEEDYHPNLISILKEEFPNLSPLSAVDDIELNELILQDKRTESGHNLLSSNIFSPHTCQLPLHQPPSSAWPTEMPYKMDVPRCVMTSRLHSISSGPPETSVNNFCPSSDFPHWNFSTSLRALGDNIYHTQSEESHTLPLTRNTIGFHIGRDSGLVCSGVSGLPQSIDQVQGLRRVSLAKVTSSFNSSTSQISHVSSHGLSATELFEGGVLSIPSSSQHHQPAESCMPFILHHQQPLGSYLSSTAHYPQASGLSVTLRNYSEAIPQGGDRIVATNSVSIMTSCIKMSSLQTFCGITEPYAKFQSMTDQHCSGVSALSPHQIFRPRQSQQHDLKTQDIISDNDISLHSQQLPASQYKSQAPSPSHLPGQLAQLQCSELHTGIQQRPQYTYHQPHQQPTQCGLPDSLAGHNDRSELHSVTSRTHQQDEVSVQHQQSYLEPPLKKQKQHRVKKVQRQQPQQQVSKPGQRPQVRKRQSKQPTLPPPSLPPHSVPCPISPQVMSNPDEERNGNQSLRNFSICSPGLQMTKPLPSGKIDQMFGLGSIDRSFPPDYAFASQSSVASAPHQQTPPQFEYFGHECPELVPAHRCLIGCVFYLCDYPCLVGEDEIATWTQVIGEFGGSVSNVYGDVVTHVLCANQQLSTVKVKVLEDEKRMVTAFWLNDCLLQKKMLPPWQALHIPLMFTEEKPCRNQIITITNFSGEERKRAKQMISAIGAKYTGYMTRMNSVLVCKKPGGLKFEKAKEWRVPVVNVQWLSDLVLGKMDALRLPVHVRYLQVGNPRDFNADLGKVWQWMMGWRVPISVSKDALASTPNICKRVKFGMTDLQHESVSKKIRLDEGLPPEDPRVPRIMFTGYPSTVVRCLTAIARKLGAWVTENAQDCSHLVSQKLTRTIKFFHAINCCDHILTKEWLEESSLQGKLLDEGKYALLDKIGEMETGCNLQESLHRAKTSNLFQGLIFYITPGVIPPVEQLKKIIESAGGAVLKRRPSAKSTNRMRDDKGRSTFLVITCPNDLHLCRDLLAQNIDVYSAEMALTGVLRQELDRMLYRLDYQAFV